MVDRFVEDYFVEEVLFCIVRVVKGKYMRWKRNGIVFKIVVNGKVRYVL